MRRSLVAAWIAIACLLAAAPACKRGPERLREGVIVPDFVLPRLDGKIQKLSNYRGKVVLVNLWATWCPPCIEEMPVLERVQTDFGPQGVVVLALAADDDPEAVRAFVKEHPVTFDVLLDVGGEVGTRYGITGYPETFVVDREGRFQKQFIGPLPSDAGRPADELSRTLTALLGG